MTRKAEYVEKLFTGFGVTSMCRRGNKDRNNTGSGSTFSNLYVHTGEHVHDEKDDVNSLRRRSTGIRAKQFPNSYGEMRF